MTTIEHSHAIAEESLRQAMRLHQSGRRFEAIELATVAARAAEQLVQDLINAETEAAAVAKTRQLCKIGPNERGGFSISVKDGNGDWRSLGSGPKSKMLDLARFNGFEVEDIEAHLDKPHADKVNAFIPVNVEVAHA